MKAGKLSESVLKRSVFKRIKNKDPEVLLPPGVGRDYSALDVGEDEVVVTATGAFPEIGCDPVLYPVMSAVNNLAAAGAETVGIQIGAFLPTDTEETELKRLVDRADELCAALKIRALGGHTQITASVGRPVISVTAVGKVKGKSLITSSGAKPGNDIVVTKWIGLAGTGFLACEKETIIAEKFNAELINGAKFMLEKMSVLPEAAIASGCKVAAMHDLSQGGIYNGLWEMAESSKVGLSIDLKRIPLKQETVEICEIFDINPYRLLSGGSLLIAAEDGEGLVSALTEKGINATVIGRFTDSNDRIIMNEDEVTYLDSPKQEELLKILNQNGG